MPAQAGIQAELGRRTAGWTPAFVVTLEIRFAEEGMSR
jgi:hypothetical protein